MKIVLKVLKYFRVVLFSLFTVGSSVLDKDKGSEDARLLANLPLEELLAQKKLWEMEASKVTEDAPAAMALVDAPPKDFRRKTFHEDDHEDHGSWVHKKKESHKVHDILNTSITALSYLAFGGYLLCMIVAVLREKRRRVLATYPLPGALGPQTNSHLTNVLQQYMVPRPVGVRFPAVTVTHGRRKKRRRRSDTDSNIEDDSLTKESFMVVR